MTDPLLIAKSAAAELALLPALANRHGLITGATGTGKTISLQVLAERFSRIGVPVFAADVKGDLSGLAKAGVSTPKLEERLASRGLPAPAFGGCPVAFWDVFGTQGHPVRATVSDMGPLLIARLLNLNDTQEGVLSIVFRVADDNGLLLLDLKDLRAMLQFVGDHASEVKTQYGNVSPASIGAIQRGLLQLEDQGGDAFFGEPMLDIGDLMQTTDGQGVVNILAADKLMANPRLYACFLLWMLSELFENLPEVGDLEKPKLVFFFDEAHLLFSDAPTALVEKVELVVRLIRSKGVGVYFITQNPIDVPEQILGQLGNRVQHALRAFTPRDQKAVRATAETMRANPGLDIEKAILELGVGEALVSFLDAKGTPGITERAWMYAPGSQIGPVTAEERNAARERSLVAGVYEKAVDRESAFEMLKARADAGAATSTGGGAAAGAPMGGTSAPAGGGMGAGAAGAAGGRARRAWRVDLRNDRSARRQARRDGRSRGEERGADRGEQHRARVGARRARVAARRRAATALTRRRPQGQANPARARARSAERASCSPSLGRLRPNRSSIMRTFSSARARSSSPDGRDLHAHRAAVASAAVALHGLRALELVNETRDPRGLLDEAIAHGERGQPLRPGAAQDAQHVVLRGGDAEGIDRLGERAANEGRRAHDRDERLFGGARPGTGLADLFSEGAGGVGHGQ
jgi:DNA helicase HerA-like ATPase